MHIADIMTPEPLSVGPDATLDEARTKLQEIGARHLPVVSADRLIGVISSTDFGRSGDRVRDLMSTKLVVTRPDERVDVAAARLALQKIGCLPVVEGDDRLVGIVTTYDLLDALLKWLRAKP